MTQSASASAECLQTALPLAVPWAGKLTPWDALLRLADLSMPILLESVQVGGECGRYSWLTAEPFAVLRARGRQLCWQYRGETFVEQGDPWLALRRFLAPFRQWPHRDIPPFPGGVAGVWSYELVQHLERVPRAGCDELGLSELVVGVYDWVLAWDHQTEQCWLVSSGWPEPEVEQRYRRAWERLNQVQAWLEHRPGVDLAQRHATQLAEPGVSWCPQFSLPRLAGLTSNFSRAGFEAAVRRAIDYVHAGDCFQVNLAQRLLYPARLSPLQLYARLRQCNPAPFAGYFDAGEYVLVSASPELFLRVSPDGWVETRPIKGTRPRGATGEQDLRLQQELLTSGKDRAENVMIVDLLRNDLGRVCRYGTIQVADLCRLESYRTVHHLVSVVRGQLRPECDAFDLLRAAFPGGSVTGAPKVRAMEIIAELEPTVRGPYCGALGFLGFDGSAEWNILIRTCTVARGWIQFPVGGGIVADSEPAREYEETLHKAEGILRALE
ncbi:MAG: aminodeoxychorismate synthase component I [Gemmatales bacterium]|nr:aminodeoxychorismate synthase component I [Gemmatales bacterium]